jgi:tubulin beta
MFCDEHGINVFYHEASYHEASGGKYARRAVLFDLEPGVMYARASPLGERFYPSNLVDQNVGAGINWAKGHYTSRAKILLSNPEVKQHLK